MEISSRPFFVALAPRNPGYQDMEVKKDEFQIIRRVVEKKSTEVEVEYRMLKYWACPSISRRSLPVLPVPPFQFRWIMPLMTREVEGIPEGVQNAAIDVCT